MSLENILLHLFIAVVTGVGSALLGVGIALLVCGIYYLIQKYKGEL